MFYSVLFRFGRIRRSDQCAVYILYSLFVAAILHNTRCGGAGRAVVDRKATGGGAGGAKRARLKIQDGARLANGTGFPR